MTPEELLDAKKVAVQLRNVLASYDPSADSLFASVGPSALFLDTQLNTAGVTTDQIQAAIRKIDAAIENDDVDTITKILAVGEGLLKGIAGFIL